MALGSTHTSMLPQGKFSMYRWMHGLFLGCDFGYVDRWILANLNPVGNDIPTNEISEHQEIESIQ